MPAGDAAKSAAATGNERGGENMPAVIASFCARQGFIFGDGHAANRVILLKDENLQPRPGEITGAREAIVPCADDNGVLRIRHAQDTTTISGAAKRLTFGAIKIQ